MPRYANPICEQTHREMQQEITLIAYKVHNNTEVKPN